MEAIPLDTAVRVADLAAKDSVVAIAAADNPDYDYYLMKVTSDGVVELDEPTTDDYGCTFPLALKDILLSEITSLTWLTN